MMVMTINLCTVSIILIRVDSTTKLYLGVADTRRDTRDLRRGMGFSDGPGWAAPPGKMEPPFDRPRSRGMA
jgi:hypothetical protein